MVGEAPELLMRAGVCQPVPHGHAQLFDECRLVQIMVLSGPQEQHSFDAEGSREWDRAEQGLGVWATGNGAQLDRQLS